MTLLLRSLLRAALPSPFTGLGFCGSFVNADPSVIGPLGVVRGLAPQIAYGTQPSPNASQLPAWITRCYANNLVVRPWAWCAATTVAEAGVEAHYHVERCADLGLAWFIANPEEPYDAHGNSSDPRYNMLTAYVEAFHDRADQLGLDFLAVGFTSTPSFASAQTAAVQAGWVGMPQAFPLAVPGATVAACVSHATAWGWPSSQLRPLVQTYKTDGVYPDAQPFLDESAAAGVGVIPYPVESAMDTAGLALLRALVPATMRDQNGDNVAETIGTQNGVRAAVNRLRDLDPAGTLLVKTGGKWPSIDTLPADLNVWKAYDKIERALRILVETHDANA